MGATNIIYGSPSGLPATFVPNQFLNILSPELDDLVINLNSHSFGSALTSGDYNNDGNDDLAIGIPGAIVSSANVPEGGATVVIYGSTSSGLSDSTFLDYWYEGWYDGLNGIPGIPESGDKLGTSMASGDFDNDGYDDLAMGAPNDKGNTIEGNPIGGAVLILRGSSSGLFPGAQLFSQGSHHVADDSETSDSFGSGLAAGDYNGDGYDDLAIGVAQEDVVNNAVTDGGQ